MAEDNLNETQTDPSEDKGKAFVALEAIGRFSYGRDLRLKTDDVVVAVDGDPIAWDIDKFDQTLSSHAKLPSLFTIFRKGKFFEIFVERPLECNYKYASDEQVQEIIEKYPEHEIGPKDSYYGFEALRNVRRRVRLFQTDYSPFATLVPPFWLLYHRMWAPLSVVTATCTVSALVSPVLVMVVYLLLSIYFHKAQTTMLRSYALYLDYNFWFIFAERSTQKAQERLRQFDEKCQFAFSHVPEPDIDEAEEARVAALMREAQAEIQAETAGESP